MKNYGVMLTTRRALIPPFQLDSSAIKLALMPTDPAMPKKLVSQEAKSKLIPSVRTVRDLPHLIGCIKNSIIGGCVTDKGGRRKPKSGFTK